MSANDARDALKPAVYRNKPQTIEAIYFEHKGTYDVFGTKVEMGADMYAFMQDGHLMTMKGKTFRAFWELA